MRALRYNIASTLDGFIASPNHTTGWIVEDPSIDFAALYAQFSTFIMGRKTYETMFVTFGDQNPLKDRKRDQLYVVSRTMKQADHPGVTVVHADVVNTVKALKEVEGNHKEGNDIWLLGGGGLARACLQAGLVDRIEVAVMPVVIGSGVNMVAGGDNGEGAQGWKLKTAKVERLRSGIVMCEYEVDYEL